MNPHKHVGIPNHSPEQCRMFFALGQTIGHDPDELKERAKKRFNVDCFNKLNKLQIGELIDKLLAQQARLERLN